MDTRSGFGPALYGRTILHLYAYCDATLSAVSIPWAVLFSLPRATLNGKANALLSLDAVGSYQARRLHIAQVVVFSQTAL